MTLPSHLPAAAAFTFRICYYQQRKCAQRLFYSLQAHRLFPQDADGTSREARFLLGGRASSFDPSSSLDAQTVRSASLLIEIFPCVDMNNLLPDGGRKHGVLERLTL